MKIFRILGIGVMAVMIASCSGKKESAGNDSASTQQSAPVEQTEHAAVAVEPVDSLPTVVDFFATWCGPCKQIAPVFDALKEEYAGKVNFVSIDVDKYPHDARRFGVEAMPTFVFLDREGNEVERIVGADPDALRAYTSTLAHSAAAVQN